MKIENLVVEGNKIYYSTVTLFPEYDTDNGVVIITEENKKNIIKRIKSREYVINIVERDGKILWSKK